MDMNHRLDDVENASTTYVHQAEKFRIEATNVRFASLPEIDDDRRLESF